MIEVLRSDMDVTHKKNEIEVEKFNDQIAGLNDKLDQLLEENKKLKRGEGVDLEAIIDSDEFAEIKDCMDDAVGD